MLEARAAAALHGTQLLVTFGGNGRSTGFGTMVSSAASRARFVRELVPLCEAHGLQGVDYNWEYPGYDFGKGYDESRLGREYAGLFSLLRETRAAFGSSAAAPGGEGGEGAGGRGVTTITMAYYPDGRQEKLLAAGGAPQCVDLFHAMA